MRLNLALLLSAEKGNLRFYKNEALKDVPYYNYGGTARTMPVDSLEKILCRISIAIIRIFRYNRKDTRQVYAGGLWGVLRRLFVMI